MAQSWVTDAIEQVAVYAPADPVAATQLPALPHLNENGTVIAFIVKAVVGLRPTEEVEVNGLDLAEHGEEGYHG